MDPFENVTQSPPPTMPTHVLLVDDAPDLGILVRHKFRRAIEAGTFRFLFAANGHEALAQISDHPEVEVVLSDLDMPGMDGFELLVETRKHFPTVRTVVVSAYGDLENIRRAMNSGAFDFVTKPVDFADLERTINKTALHVRELRESADTHRQNHVLRMFVDDAVMNFVQVGDDGEAYARNVAVERTVVFIDLCSFTSLMERNAPETVLKLLNRYFDTIVTCIVAHGGQVDKFIGDAVMSTFAGPDQAEHGVHAALDAGRYLREMRSEIELQVGYSPEVSSGVHMGRVIAGPVGAPSLGRLDFTVIGDVVNTAARLQRLAKPGEVVVTADVRRGLSDRAVITPRGLHAIRGKVERLELFSVRPREESSDGIEAPRL